jgi:hypothetical protein
MRFAAARARYGDHFARRRLRHEFSGIAERSLAPSRLRFEWRNPGNRGSDRGRHNHHRAVHSVQPLWNCARQVGPGGLGPRLSTLSGVRLWAQVWFGQLTTLRVSRNRDSSGESATLSEVMGVTLDAQFSDQEIDDLYAFPLVWSDASQVNEYHHAPRFSHRAGDRSGSPAAESSASSCVA